MNAGWGRLDGVIDEKGRLILSLEAKELGKVKYTYQNTFSKLKGISFDIAFIPQNRTHFRDTSTLTHKSFEEIKEQAGIKAYYEGFRVFPYGEPDDDWLGIEHDVARRYSTISDDNLKKLADNLSLNSKKILLLHPRNRNLLGKVFTRKSEHLDIKMDREGFMENEGLSELKRALRISLNWLTIQYGVYQRQLKERKYNQVKDDFAKEYGQSGEAGTTSAIELLVNTARLGPDKGIERPVEAIRKAESLIRAKIESAESELTILRMVASTAPMMFVFAHEVRGVINRLDTHAALIQKYVSSIEDGSLSKKLEFLAGEFTQSSKRLSDITKMFDIFSSPRDSQKNKFYLSKVCRQIVDSFGFIASEFHVDVDISDVDPRIKVGPILEAELYSIVTNLFSNAIKASIVSKRREIRIEASKNDQVIEMKVLDKGVGLSKGNWANVFNPMVRDPDDLIYKNLAAKIGDERITTLGQGSGLGLGIVKSILESNQSTIGFVDPPEGWSTCVRVSFNG